MERHPAAAKYLQGQSVPKMNRPNRAPSGVNLDAEIGPQARLNGITKELSDLFVRFHKLTHNDSRESCMMNLIRLHDGPVKEPATGHEKPTLEAHSGLRATSWPTSSGRPEIRCQETGRRGGMSSIGDRV
jgi:hypothetical protein